MTDSERKVMKTWTRLFLQTQMVSADELPLDAEFEDEMVPILAEVMREEMKPDVVKMIARVTGRLAKELTKEAN